MPGPPHQSEEKDPGRTVRCLPERNATITWCWTNCSSHATFGRRHLSQPHDCIFISERQYLGNWTQKVPSLFFPHKRQKNSRAREASSDLYLIYVHHHLVLWSSELVNWACWLNHSWSVLYIWVRPIRLSPVFFIVYRHISSVLLNKVIKLFYFLTLVWLIGYCSTLKNVDFVKSWICLNFSCNLKPSGKTLVGQSGLPQP